MSPSLIFVLIRFGFSGGPGVGTVIVWMPSGVEVIAGNSGKPRSCKSISSNVARSSKLTSGPKIRPTVFPAEAPGEKSGKMYDPSADRKIGDC